MREQIDLYRTDDYVTAGRMPLRTILRSVFEPMLGMPLDDAHISITFDDVPDYGVLDGHPSVRNLRGSLGYATVHISDAGTVLYQHPHAVREIVGRPLQRLLSQRAPDETHWGYGIVGPGIEDAPLVRPAPHVEGAVNLRIGPDHKPVCYIEPVSDDPLEAVAADLTGDRTAGDHPGGRVRFSAQVVAALLRHFPFSAEVEEGGFLVGQVLRDPRQPGRHLVRVDHAIPAQRTGASLMHLTFTGESFVRANEAVDLLEPPSRLVGWYHTHLFPADHMGLSPVDVDLHSRMFLQRWHIAGLVNIDGDSRQLRVYGWDGTCMNELAYWSGPS